MRHINFQGSNWMFDPPRQLADQQPEPMYAYVQRDPKLGLIHTDTMWQPNKEDLANIAAGRPIMLRVMGMGMAKVEMYSINENDEPEI